MRKTANRSPEPIYTQPKAPTEPSTTVRAPLSLKQTGLPHAASYWAETADTPRLSHGQFRGEKTVDVAIIGAGYTGLSAAYHLAKKHNLKATVLEANQVGWGASGRNGGFCMISAGKSDHAKNIRKYGVDEARKRFTLGLDAVCTVERIADELGLDFERSTDGWLCVAHSPDLMVRLKALSSLLRKQFGYDSEILSKDELTSKYLRSDRFHGGLLYPNCFGLHPMKYVQGLANAAVVHGAKIHSATPVIDWGKSGRLHILSTPKGTVRAEKVLVATGGYTLDRLHPWLAGRVLPAISNIAVTRPLTLSEQVEAGLLSTTVTSDTRKLVSYFRLLPDGRLLFGARGGINDNPHENTSAYTALMRRMRHTFPSLSGTKVTHFWRGWLCLSRDQVPHIGTTDDQSIYFALGYMGTGVAMASHFGRLAAEKIAGAPESSTNQLFKHEMPRFEVPELREMVLRLAYLTYGLRDRFR